MSNSILKIKQIEKLVTEAARYEQLAEECSELAQASLKMARILRGENKTPVTIDEAKKNIREEYTDVKLCTDALSIYPSYDIYNSKLDRWIERNS